MLSRNGKRNGNGNFDWKDALCDAGITAAVTFFTALGGSGVAELGYVKGFLVASVAAGGQFFAFLAVKRGLTKTAN